MKPGIPNRHGVSLNHFKERWNERYGETIGPYTKQLRQTILDKIYYGESEMVKPTMHDDMGLLRIEAVEVNGQFVYVIYNEQLHELFSALPPDDEQVRRFIAWKNRKARQQACKR